MMLPTMEIPMPSAANGGFGGLGVDDLNAAAVHPAQILGAAAAAQSSQMGAADEAMEVAPAGDAAGGGQPTQVLYEGALCLWLVTFEPSARDALGAKTLANTINNAPLR